MIRSPRLYICGGLYKHFKMWQLVCKQSTYLYVERTLCLPSCGRKLKCFNFFSAPSSREAHRAMASTFHDDDGLVSNQIFTPDRVQSSTAVSRGGTLSSRWSVFHMWSGMSLRHIFMLLMFNVYSAIRQTRHECPEVFVYCTNIKHPYQQEIWHSGRDYPEPVLPYDDREAKRAESSEFTPTY